MKALRCLTALAAIVYAGSGYGAGAFAQATRTWISGVGDDANPCSRTAPCKTFAGAISKTAVSGEIDCLDPAGFGAVTITKAITLRCDGASNGGVLVAGTNGIVINAGASDAVVLSGLDFEGLSPTGSGALNGISFLAGGSLTVVNSIIRNFGQNGINFAPHGAATLYVDNVVITNSGASATFAGIQIRPTGSANATATINATQITGGLYGIVADGAATTGRISGIVRNSNVNAAGQNGITASNGTAANVTLMIDNVSVANNGNHGLTATGANAGMLVGASSIFNNAGGVFTSTGGVLVSYGNNRLNGNNGNDGSFSSTMALR